MTGWHKEENGSSGPCQRKEVEADSEKPLMVTKTLVSEIMDPVLMADQ